jgi:hypothetical protein
VKFFQDIRPKYLNKQFASFLVTRQNPTLSILQNVIEDEKPATQEKSFAPVT